MAKTRRRKKRTHVEEVADPAKKKEPQTFVFRRGKLSAPLADLEMDLRRMMMPNTAMNLKETRRNVIKDFVQVAGPLGVSHFLILTATERASYLRVAKTPRGPTMTLRIHGWSLMRDVQASQARPRVPASAFTTPPLVVLSGFAGQEHLKLATVLFQAMFPAINVRRARLSSCQRVVLLTRDKATGLMSLRHYTISVAPSGVRKSVKALLSRRDLPDLGACNDVSEFISKSGYGSESEGEDAEASRVSLAQDLGKGNQAGHTSRVRLHEVGPRLELELLKVEEGMCEGKVLYHAHVAKTPEEAAQLHVKHEEKANLKDTRRRQQEDNVRRKESLKKAKAETAQAAKDAAAGKGRRGDNPEQRKWWEKHGQDAADGGGGGGDDDDDEEEEDGGHAEGGARRKRPRSTAGDDVDDDAAYFEQEVGHAPEDTDMVGRGQASAGRRPSGLPARRGGGGRGRGRGGSGGSGGGGGRGGRGGGGGGGEREAAGGAGAGEEGGVGSLWGAARWVQGFGARAGWRAGRGAWAGVRRARQAGRRRRGQAEQEAEERVSM